MPRGLNFISGVPVVRGPNAAFQKGQQNRADLAQRMIQNEGMQSDLDYAPTARRMAEEEHQINLDKRAQEEEAFLMGQKALLQQEADKGGLDILAKYQSNVEGGMLEEDALIIANDDEAAMASDISKRYPKLAHLLPPVDGKWNYEEAMAYAKGPQLPLGELDRAKADLDRAKAEDLRNPSPAAVTSPKTIVSGKRTLQWLPSEGRWADIGPAPAAKDGSVSAPTSNELKIASSAVKADGRFDGIEYEEEIEQLSNWVALRAKELSSDGMSATDALVKAMSDASAHLEVTTSERPFFLPDKEETKFNPTTDLAARVEAYLGNK